MQTNLKASKERHRRLFEPGEALPESASSRETILESLQTGIVIIDPDTHTVVDLNTAAANLIGESREQIVGSICHAHICPAERGHCPITDLAQTVDNSERILLRGDGTKIPIIKTVTSITLGGRNLLVESFIDITARKQAEAAVAASNERYRSLFDNMLSSYAHCRMIFENGVPADYEYIAVNKAFERVTGLRDVAGQRVSDLIPGYCEDNPESLEYFGRVARTGEPAVWEHYLAALKRWFSFSAYSPAPGEFVVMSENITERKRLEQQVRESQKMEAIGRLAGGVAHDFNNILQALMGYTEIVLSEMPEDDRHRTDMVEIRKAALHAADLTQQLLAFSRRQLLLPKMLDLNAVVHSAQKMLQRVIGEDIQVITHLAPGLRRIKADAGQLVQVIMNLAVNARDAMPQGGRLTISTTNVAFDAQEASAIAGARAGQFVCLAVADTGIGMSREVREHIFEPFFTTKGLGKGTGLGLSVIYGIAQQQQGWVDVVSEEGQGSTFKFHLPAYIGEQTEFGLPLPELPAPPRGRGERILLVEDEATVRGLAVRLLQGAGFEVHSAATAQEARQLFAREHGRFDLVFSDVVLPDQDGIELIGEFLKQRPSVAALLCSGYTDERSRWHLIEEENLAFLQKPYAAANLLKTIRGILDARPVSG